MSSLFSDPPFPRGATLLNGEQIDLDANGNPIAGVEIIGQVKAFQDIVPGTGPAAIRNSNRLTYCVAARYRGATVADASTVAGLLYAFDIGVGANGQPQSLTEFTSLATNANIIAGRDYGVLDEYLTGTLRTNDIVWLAVGGPTAAQSSGTAITNGAQIEVTGSAGQITTRSTGVAIGAQINGTPAGGTAGQKVRLLLWTNRI